MLEAEARDRVGQFDIHTQIVGIELELVAGNYGGVFSHCQREDDQRRFHGEAPVAVFSRMCFESGLSGAAWPHMLLL